MPFRLRLFARKLLKESVLKPARTDAKVGLPYPEQNVTLEIIEIICNPNPGMYNIYIYTNSCLGLYSNAEMPLYPSQITDVANRTVHLNLPSGCL